MKSLLGLLEPEEFVGKLWHRVTGLGVEPRFPEAASNLDAARGSLGMVFRGLGGTPALTIAGVGDRATERRPTWRERLSGARMAIVSRRDNQALYLPAVIDLW